MIGELDFVSPLGFGQYRYSTVHLGLGVYDGFMTLPSNTKSEAEGREIMTG